MRKIERDDIVGVSKVVNDSLDLEFELEVKSKFFGHNKIRFTAEAFLKMRDIIETLLKDDFYSGKAQDRMVEKFLKTPIPGETEADKKAYRNVDGGGTRNI